MNLVEELTKRKTIEFPSPTGVNYYEYKQLYYIAKKKGFPSPTGVNYYESNVANVAYSNITVSVPNRG